MTVRNLLSDIGVWTTGDVVLDAGPTMASPNWWGADSERYSGRTDIADDAASSAAFVKVMESQTRDYVDFGATFASATGVGDTGIGPKVFISDADSGAGDGGLHAR